MHRILRLLACLPLLLMAAAAPPGTGAVLTPAGGHLTGNPAAPVRLVEYISYTCPHCAAFQAAADAPLRLGYVRGGKVSVEVRNLVRDPVDMAAALLTNCGAPARFAVLHAAVLSRQAEWMQRVEATTEAQRARWEAGPVPQRMRAIAGDAGFYDLVGADGIGRAEADRCLADPAVLKRLLAQRTEADRLGVAGTPSFLIDGALLAGTYSWPSLETQLKARL